MELEIQWQEHELGSYPTFVLLWEDAMRGTPWNYLERCRVALTAHENGGELPPRWSMPPVRSEDDDSDSVPFDPDKALSWDRSSAQFWTDWRHSHRFANSARLDLD